MKKNSDNTSTNLDKYNQIYYLNMAGQATGDILNYLSNVVRFCPNEVGYTLNYYPNGVDYNYQISKIQSGTPTSVSLSFYQSTISSIHIHPFGVNSGPSAGDALTLISTNQTFSSNYTTSFVMAYDGSQYALVIEDSDLAEIFFDTNSEGSNAIFDANGDWITNPNYNNDGLYPKDSELRNDYNRSKVKLTESGMSEKYHAFENFKGDTLQYLSYNFVENKSEYLGNSFAAVIHDLEIESPYCNYDTNMYPIGYVKGINLYFIEKNKGQSTKTKNKTVLLVKFEQLIKTEAIWSVRRNYGDGMTKEMVKFLQSSKVADINVYQYNKDK